MIWSEACQTSPISVAVRSVECNDPHCAPGCSRMIIMRRPDGEAIIQEHGAAWYTPTGAQIDGHDDWQPAIPSGRVQLPTVTEQAA